jgi:hypothetical protein
MKVCTVEHCNVRNLFQWKKCKSACKVFDSLLLVMHAEGLLCLPIVRIIMYWEGLLCLPIVNYYVLGRASK